VLKKLVACNSGNGTDSTSSATTAAGVAGPLVDYPFDTTRTAVQLVLNGIVDRYPRPRVILAQAGGFLPYASHRLAELARVFRPDAADRADILASFMRFYFDTALSSGPAALPSLKAFAGRAASCSAATSPTHPSASARPSPPSWTPMTA
jgi:aminocarboxymuconate-semialdehyde decarboxylase